MSNPFDVKRKRMGWRLKFFLIALFSFAAWMAAVRKTIKYEHCEKCLHARTFLTYSAFGINLHEETLTERQHVFEEVLMVLGYPCDHEGRPTHKLQTWYGGVLHYAHFSGTLWISCDDCFGADHHDEFIQYLGAHPDIVARLWIAIEEGETQVFSKFKAEFIEYFYADCISQ